jgi:hypothetical protein
MKTQARKEEKKREKKKRKGKKKKRKEKIPLLPFLSSFLKKPSFSLLKKKKFPFSLFFQKKKNPLSLFFFKRRKTLFLSFFSKEEKPSFSFFFQKEKNTSFSKEKISHNFQLSPPSVKPCHQVRFVSESSFAWGGAARSSIIEANGLGLFMGGGKTVGKGGGKGREWGIFHFE